MTSRNRIPSARHRSNLNCDACWRSKHNRWPCISIDNRRWHDQRAINRLRRETALGPSDFCCYGSRTQSKSDRGISSLFSAVIFNLRCDIGDRRICQHQAHTCIKPRRVRKHHRRELHSPLRSGSIDCESLCIHQTCDDLVDCDRRSID